MLAQVIVLAGPSGAGKSRLAARVGLPVLRLDDFYKDGADPSLPRIAGRANSGVVDWDDPESWLPLDALAAIEELCTTGHAKVPTYDISRDGRTGTHELELAGSSLFVAEGIFAQEIVADCLERGLLARAYCVRQHPMVTFWRRLTRDLREHRKPPLVLLLRGLALMRDQRRVVHHAVQLGCQPATTEEALAAIRALMSGNHLSSPYPAHGPAAHAIAARLVQPNQRTCGSAALVMARVVEDPAYGAYLVDGVDPVEGRRQSGSLEDRFGTEALAMHRRTNRLVDARGRLQQPWPRALGTLPWTVARQRSIDSGTTYDARLVLRRQRARAFDRIRATVSAGCTIPIFVGDRLSARHVVLAIGTAPQGVLVYDPARGGISPIGRDDFVHGRLALAGWQVPWFVIVPRSPRDPY